jgi:hypothetical protein
MSTQPNPHIGSSFDTFLAEEGMLEACEEQAIKELVAEQIARAMQEQGSPERPWQRACERAVRP